MQLQTNRLLLREIVLDDIETIHELHSLPETDRYNTLGIPETIQTTEQIVKEWLKAQNTAPQTSYIFCMESVDTKQLIGLMALMIGKPAFKNAEVWYKTHVNHWRKGYTSEALAAVLAFGFNELKLHRIEAGCAVENTASSKVLEKAGMTKEGMKRQILPIRGEWKDAYSYAILDVDYYRQNQ
ncbi:GNAT family N-acetyltransferase [Runella sp.]|uniref:GNAT family N-acetyltransferase n=1 Tax=Runella sp. TaxID=1960881 RepID=UPI003D152BE9